MTSFPAIMDIEDLTEDEKEMIEAFLVREIVDIVDDELEYFYSYKEKLLQTLAGNINFRRANPLELEQKINRLLVCSEELEMLLVKVHKRILRELNKANFRYDFHLQVNAAEDLPKFELAISEEMKTLKLSSIMSKGINMAWKMASKKLLPYPLAKISNKLSVGDYLVSAIAVGPKKQEAEIKARFLKITRATLEQYRHELRNLIVKQIAKQLFKVHHGYPEAVPSGLALVKYA